MNVIDVPVPTQYERKHYTDVKTIAILTRSSVIPKDVITSFVKGSAAPHYVLNDSAIYQCIDDGSASYLGDDDEIVIMWLNPELDNGVNIVELSNLVLQLCIEHGIALNRIDTTDTMEGIPWIDFFNGLGTSSMEEFLKENVG